MSFEQQHPMNLYSQIDVSPDVPELSGKPKQSTLSEMNSLLSGISFLMKDMLAAQDRQNELLEELVGQISMVHRQRMLELASWKQAHPDLSYFCKMASEKLGKVQTEMLSTITGEIEESYANLLDNEFELGDFVDRFGPRFAHLNGLLQVLTQLGNAPDLASPSQPYAK